MATKKVDEKKTLKYAVAFYFCTSGKINFMLGNKIITTRLKSTRF